MHHCWLRDAGMSWIAKIILRQSSPIHEIHLSHNAITDVGASQVIEALNKHPQQCYPYQDPFGSEHFCPCWLRLEQNSVSHGREILEAASESGCRYKVLSRSSPEWTPMKAPWHFAKSFETCPMFTALLFHTQLLQDAAPRSSVGKAAFAQAQELVKTYLDEANQLAEPQEQQNVEQKKSEETMKAEKKKEPREENKREKKGQTKDSSGEQKLQATTNDHDIAAVLEASTWILKDVPGQKMKASAFEKVLCKDKPDFKKTLNGIGGVAVLCDCSEGRFKVIAGSKKKEAEVQLVDADKNPNSSTGNVLQSDEMAVTDAEKVAFFEGLLKKNQTDPLDAPEDKAESMDLSMPAKRDRLFGAMSISDLEEAKMAPLPSEPPDLVAIADLGNRRGVQGSPKHTAEKEKKVEQKKRSRVETSDKADSKKEKQVLELVENVPKASAKDSRQLNWTFLSKLPKRMGRMLIKLDKAKYLSLADYNHSTSPELKELLPKWSKSEWGLSVIQDVSPDTSPLKSVTQEFRPVKHVDDASAMQLSGPPPWFSPGQMPSLPGLIPPPLPLAVDPNVAENLSQYLPPRPPFLGGPVRPLVPGAFPPPPPGPYPPGYLGPPMMMPVMPGMSHPLTPMQMYASAADMSAHAAHQAAMIAAANKSYVGKSIGPVQAKQKRGGEKK